MDNKNKTSLEEAKINYQEIRNYALKQANKELEESVNKKVDEILKEQLSIEIDDEGNATIKKDENVIEINNGEVEVEDISMHNSENKDINSDDEEYEKNWMDNNIDNDEDNEEIEVDKNIEEMTTLEQEQPQNLQNQNNQEGGEQPEDLNSNNNIETDFQDTENSTPVDDDVLQLAQIINKIIDKKINGNENEENQGVDVDYIDDEEKTSQNIEQPQPQQNNQPQQNVTQPQQNNPVNEENHEDDILEFTLDEIKKDDENEILEFDLNEESEEESLSIESDPEAMLTAFSDMSRERPDWKDEEPAIDIPKVNEEELDEIKGVSKTLRNTSNRLGLEPREGTPNLQESIKKQKALYESKLDELKKENKSLLESNKEMSEVIKNFQSSFKDLRTQFDEMQTFNAKLAYANKIFASGGLSVSDKAKIAEQFDKTSNVEEAKKLYNKILEENKISIKVENASKIKNVMTNSTKPKIIFESEEMKRRKILAGIEKNEDYI